MQPFDEPTTPGAAEPAAYETVEEAAIAVLDWANPLSVRNNLEYGGWIFRDASGRFGFTAPYSGGETSFRPTAVPVPEAVEIVGQYHTHGDYSIFTADERIERTSDPERDDFNSDRFSEQDRSVFELLVQRYPGMTAYLGTPSGRYLYHDPEYGIEGVLHEGPRPMSGTGGDAK